MLPDTAGTARLEATTHHHFHWVLSLNGQQGSRIVPAELLHLTATCLRHLGGRAECLECGTVLSQHAPADLEKAPKAVQTMNKM